MRERAVTGKVATIGVDVGGTSISCGLVRQDGEVLATVETPTHVSGLGTALKTLLAVIHDVYSQARAQGWTVDGIGVGLPGPVDVAAPTWAADSLPAKRGGASWMERARRSPSGRPAPSTPSRRRWCSPQRPLAIGSRKCSSTRRVRRSPPRSR